jgi:hypothetical protein
VNRRHRLLFTPQIFFLHSAALSTWRRRRKARGGGDGGGGRERPSSLMFLTFAQLHDLSLKALFFDVVTPSSLLSLFLAHPLLLSFLMSVGIAFVGAEGERGLCSVLLMEGTPAGEGANSHRRCTRNT